MNRQRSKAPSLVAYFIALAVVLAVALLWFQSLTKPVEKTSEETQVFVIKRGQGVAAIADNLHQEGLIRSPIAFRYVVAKMGVSQSIQAGSFRLSPGMSAFEITDELTHGTLDVWVTLLEGWRREEIAAAISKAYQEQGAEFDQEVFLDITAGQEGFLFPDTYLFPLDASEETVASMLQNTFDQKLSSLNREIQASPYTQDQIVTMASLLEREANNLEDMRLVAGILYKRLENDWPLQVDATLQYVTGYHSQQDTWWAPPTAAEKALNSPYNTYQNTGLPPGPICSPSLTALEAAATPISSENWFYLTDLEGNMRYSVTLEQHNANIARYLR